MDLQKELQQKQEEFKKMVERFNQIQLELKELNENALRTDGAIKMLQKLINNKGGIKYGHIATN